jgi:hypothetical protein
VEEVVQDVGQCMDKPGSGSVFFRSIYCAGI